MLNYLEYCKLWDKHAPSQEKMEYFLFLQFAKNYLDLRGVVKPMVVEIGVRGVKQSAYYRQLLNADYIGIDIEPKPYDFIICGDSTKQSTVDELKNRLNGRSIDLLFIDGWHTYDVARSDWEKYSLLTKHIVAIHDIKWLINYYPDSKKINPNGDTESVYRLWKEIEDQQKYATMTFKVPSFIEVMNNDNTVNGRYYGDSGIGVVMLDHKPEVRWQFNKENFYDMWGSPTSEYPDGGRAYPGFKKV